jgi:drug/metabolite transporter (DMT)-like permease
MLGNDWLPVVLSTGLFLALAISWEIVSRRRAPRQDDPAILPVPAVQTKRAATIWVTFVCTVAAIWLIPWAMSVPTASSAWVSGTVFLGLLSIGAAYALQNKGSNE